jgi:hypothetical protein
MVSHQGTFTGYLRPYFRDLSFEPMPKDRDGLGVLWANLVNAMKDIFENDNGVVATQVPVSGEIKKPDVDFWAAAFELVKNAWFQSLAQGFKSPELAPAPAAKQVSPTPSPSD